MIMYKKQVENLRTEYEKLLIMLRDKFPEAFEYYTERLYPPKKLKE